MDTYQDGDDPAAMKPPYKMASTREMDWRLSADLKSNQLDT